MDKVVAKDLIEDTFQHSFNKELFYDFVNNLLNHIEPTPSTVYRGNLIPDAYKPYIQTLDRLGKYEDPEEKKIDILIVHLKKDTSLEHARTMQRNFIAWYLNGSRGGVLKDAALVAFVSPGHIKPLPNLDYKIMQGNSLLEEFEGIKLFDEKLISSKPFDETQIKEVKEKRSKLQKEFINLHNRGKLTKAERTRIEAEQGKLAAMLKKITTPQLRDKAHLCFIAPNKFMRAGYGKNTRNLLATEVTPKVVIDFCDLPIFDATTYPAILLVERRGVLQYAPAGTANDADVGAWRAMPLRDEFLAATFTDAKQLDHLENTLSEIGFSMPVSALKEEGWNLEPPEVLALMEKLRKAGTPLGEYVKGRFCRGILTGLNEAFVIDKQTRERLIAEDPKSEELIKPWLRGRDIKKWKAEWAEMYLIYIPWHFKLEKYTAVLKHLEQYRSKLENRNVSERGRYEWYALQRYAADYYHEFEKPKIIYPNITKTNIFAFDSTGIVTNQKCFIIPTDDTFLLAVLNSKVGTQWFYSTLPLLRGAFFEPSSIFMQHFPIAKASDKEKAPIIKYVEKIIANPDSPDVPSLEKEIDELIYEIYDLTSEEIAIVEGKSNRN